MNDNVKRFIKEKRDELAKQKQKEKEEVLIDLGLYEKEYSKQNEYSSEYSNFEWNEEKEQNMYYKKKALDVTDEEYEEIISLLKIEKNNCKHNSIAMVLKIIAWITYISGFVAGFFYGYDGYELQFSITFTYWCVAFISGTMFLGFSEIIEILNNIKNKL